MVWRTIFPVFMVVMILALLPVTVFAQDEGIRITSYTLYYYEGPKVETPYLLAGKAYKAQLTIEMGPKTPPNVPVIVETDLASYRGGEIFIVKEANVEYNTSENKLLFIAKPGGKISLEITGMIPSDVTVKEVNGLELHYKVVLSVVKMYYANNPTTPIDEKRYDVIDEVMEEYYKLANEKKKLLDIPDTDETWRTMVKGMISLADKYASRGLVLEALDILKAIPDKPITKPPEGKDTMYYMIMGVLAVVMIVAIVMWVRATGKAKFLEEKLEGIVGDLEAISVRVEKLDKRVAGELRDIIDRVKSVLS